MQDLFLSPFAKRLQLIGVARKAFVSKVRVMAAGNLKFVSPTDLAMLKADLFEDYARAFLDFLAPRLLRVAAVSLTAQLARALLGSAGGTGHDWGMSSLKQFDPQDNPHPAKVVMEPLTPCHSVASRLLVVASARHDHGAF